MNTAMMIILEKFEIVLPKIIKNTRKNTYSGSFFDTQKTVLVVTRSNSRASQQPLFRTVPGAIFSAFESKLNMLVYLNILHKLFQSFFFERDHMAPRMAPWGACGPRAPPACGHLSSHASSGGSILAHSLFPSKNL